MMILLAEGDHIKVTASKYPFPTVCADKQSTDWFHAISRTLKWNERERQKSFVVVEEGPEGEKQTKRRRKRSTSQPPKTPMGTEIIEDEEEDEVSEEEDDKFDIDDSSPEAAAATVVVTNAVTARDEKVGREKAQQTTLEEGLHKALSMPRRSAKSRSRSRSGVRSGIDSPNRFGGPPPQLSISSPRHVEFDISESAESSDAGQNGTRDDLHATKKLGSKSRIPKDRDDLKTPTAIYNRGHSRARSGELGHRAFAVWGHDESDSNASDSDA